MGPTWGPTGADRTQVGPMLGPGTFLSGYLYSWQWGILCSDASGQTHIIGSEYLELLTSNKCNILFLQAPNAAFYPEYECLSHVSFITHSWLS